MARGRVWAPAPTAQGAPHLRGPRANPAKRFAWGKGGPAAGVSVRACPEANDPKLGPTLSRCGGCATPHCLPLREKHLAPAAQLLFRLRGALCGCDPRLRASCHAARPPRRAAFIRGSSSRHSRCGLRYKRATGTFAHAAVSPPCPLSSPMRLPYALLCHAARPPRRATAHCSAEHAAGLRPACFSVCAVRCCPAPGRSALLFILPAFSPSGQPWRRPCA